MTLVAGKDDPRPGVCPGWRAPREGAAGSEPGAVSGPVALMGVRVLGDSGRMSS